MSVPANFDVRSMDHGEYRVMRVFAAIEAIYAGDPKRPPLPAGRVSCQEIVSRYEDWRLGRLPTMGGR